MCIRRNLPVATLLFLSSTVVQAQPAPPVCGNVHVKVHAVALSDPPNRSANQTMDETWPIPTGSHNFGNPANGAIVTQGWPNNGGAHSWEFLQTACQVRNAPPGPPIVQLTLTARSDVLSGVGRGTGASSDYDFEWFTRTVLPAGNWSLAVNGIVSGANVTPTCNVRIGSGAPQSIPTGNFRVAFANLSGTIGVFVSCSQGHIAIFPAGPNATSRIATMTLNNVALTFTPQP